MNTEGNLPKTPFPGSARCQAPSMRAHRGRTWDSCAVVGLDGIERRGYLDTTWGQWFYFEADGGWRKAKLDDFPNHSDGYANRFDFSKRSRSCPPLRKPQLLHRRLTPRDLTAIRINMGTSAQKWFTVEGPGLCEQVEADSSLEAKGKVLDVLYPDRRG